MDYKVVYAENITNPYAREDLFDEIEQKVEDLIEEGWVPQGGISITCNNGVIYVCQAMVREEDDDEDYDENDNYDYDENYEEDYN